MKPMLQCISVMKMIAYLFPFPIFCNRHGLGRTDYYILYDPDLNFRDIIRRHTAGEPLITKEEKEALHKKYYKKKGKEDEKGKEKEKEKEEKRRGEVE